MTSTTIENKVYLVASCGKRVKVDGIQLAGASIYFRGMVAPAARKTKRAAAHKEIHLAETSAVVCNIVDLLEGKTLNFASCFFPDRQLALAIKKYKLDCLRAALLLQCQHIVARVKNRHNVPFYSTEAFKAFIVAAHLDDSVLMVNCLGAITYQMPDRRSDSEAARLPMPVYCAMVRAGGPTRTWAGMVDNFAAEYVSKGVKAVKKE